MRDRLRAATWPSTCCLARRSCGWCVSSKAPGHACCTPLTPAPQPLSLAAVGRALWVNYKITDKRVSVTSTSPFGGARAARFCPCACLTPPPFFSRPTAEQLDASFSQMKEVRAIGRGLGYWVR